MVKEEEPRIGVYVCHCGLNIAGVVDVAKVVDAVKDLPNVVIARHYVYMCSDPGQNLIKEDIEKYKLNRVVVASCSPQMHEPTYRRLVESAGVNKYLFEMANLREQCSWVHAPWPERATEKAIDLVKMAIAKARRLRPLETRKVKVERAALIVGGGVSGVKAALDLAERGFKVYLVERRPYLGGRATQINKVAITHQDALEIVSPMLEEVMKNPNITVLTNSEVEEFSGYIGNVEITVRKKPRFVNEKCTACGKCVEVCPVEVPDEF
ncbi:MAG TPA: CoB--CoM heterodisulfide reductase iron-sulfur subunit A family protein, partial [Candidatus Bathyarchaeota archaeon]|nr:CoB--CoM heterodisulfide reductase iron-sulfur subunit A family protein [Candidatus Bathyarchaeota archaeon]